MAEHDAMTVPKKDESFKMALRFNIHDKRSLEAN